MGRSWRYPDGTAATVLSSSVVHVHPEEAAFEAMLRGWSNQQGARLLNPGTIEARTATVRRFAAFAGEYPDGDSRQVLHHRPGAAAG